MRSALTSREVLSNNKQQHTIKKHRKQQISQEHNKTKTTKKHTSTTDQAIYTKCYHKCVRYVADNFEKTAMADEGRDGRSGQQQPDHWIATEPVEPAS